MTGRRALTYGCAVLVTGALAATSLAYYEAGTASATGSASLTSPGSAVPVELTAAELPAAELLPGGTADITLAVQNANPVPVSFVLAAAGPVAAVAGTAAGTCATPGISIALPGTRLVAEPGRTVLVLPDAATMDATSDSGCQGATFQVPLSLTSQRSGR